MNFNAAALLRAREDANLTQEQLAVKAGSSFTTVNRLEGGKITSPSFATIAKLAEALHVDVADLLILDDDKNGAAA
jgi:transcriptional regulator with XRE-family HTH domain